MISVVIPTFNRHELLAAALQSLRQQTYREFDVIVVNDGHHFDARTFIDQWRPHFPITLIQNTEHSGPSRTRNTGIENASGDYVAFLDDDDLYLSDHLERAVQTLEKTSADFFYSGCLVSPSRHRLGDTFDKRSWSKNYAFNLDLFQTANFIATDSVVVRNPKNTSARFKAVLSFGEDWEMWLQLVVGLGYRVCRSPEITTVYNVLVGSGGLMEVGQAKVPSAFARTRLQIYESWPLESPRFSRFRDWMAAYDRHCDSLVLKGRSMPLNAFDNALRYLSECVAESTEPELDDVPQVLNQDYSV